MCSLLHLPKPRNFPLANCFVGDNRVSDSANPNTYEFAIINAFYTKLRSFWHIVSLISTKIKAMNFETTFLERNIYTLSACD